MEPLMDDQEEALKPLLNMEIDKLVKHLFPNKSEEARKKIVSMLPYRCGHELRNSMECPLFHPLPWEVTEALIKCGLLYNDDPFVTARTADEWLKTTVVKLDLNWLDELDVNPEEQHKREISLAGPLSKKGERKKFEDFFLLFKQLIPNPRYYFKMQQPSKRYEQHNIYARLSFYKNDTEPVPRNVAFLMLIALDELYREHAIGGLMFEMQELFRQQIWRRFAIGLVVDRDDFLWIFKFVRNKLQPDACTKMLFYAKGMRTVAKIMCVEPHKLGSN